MLQFAAWRRVAAALTAAAFLFLHHQFHQLVHRLDDDKEDDRGGDEEADHGADQYAPLLQQQVPRQPARVARTDGTRDRRGKLS